MSFSCQVFLGCEFPADEGYRAALQEGGMKVGKALADARERQSKLDIQAKTDLAHAHLEQRQYPEALRLFGQILDLNLLFLENDHECVAGVHSDMAAGWQLV